jgi:hypothetical protein
VSQEEPYLSTVTEAPRPLNTMQKQHTTSNVVVEEAGHAVSLQADAQQHELEEHVSNDDDDRYVETEM